MSHEFACLRLVKVLLGWLLIVVTATGCSPAANPKPTANKVASSRPPPPPPPSSGGSSSASLPSLSSITAIYFTELPGIDMPMEPQRPADVSTLDFNQVNQLHEDPQLVSLLGGQERTYATSDGKCEVWLPGAVVLQLPLQPKNPGRFTREYYIKTPAEKAIYQFTEGTLGEGRDEKTTIKRLTDALIGNWTPLGGKVTYRRDVSVNGLDGEEASVSVEVDGEKQVIISRTFCVERVMYALVETARERTGLTPLGEKFFGSFRQRG